MAIGSDTRCVKVLSWGRSDVRPSDGTRLSYQLLWYLGCPLCSVDIDGVLVGLTNGTAVKTLAGAVRKLSQCFDVVAPTFAPLSQCRALGAVHPRRSCSLLLSLDSIEPPPLSLRFTSLLSMPDLSHFDPPAATASRDGSTTHYLLWVYIFRVGLRFLHFVFSGVLEVNCAVPKGRE